MQPLSISKIRKKKNVQQVKREVWALLLDVGIHCNLSPIDKSFDFLAMGSGL